MTNKNTESSKIENLISDFLASEDLVKVYFENSELNVFVKYDDFSGEELETIRTQDIIWKIIRIALNAYLCFSPTGSSWNEIALQIADPSQNLEELVNQPVITLPIKFKALFSISQEAFAEREFKLDENNTAKLISILKAQLKAPSKEFADSNYLGDPTPLLKAMQNDDLPEITNLEVNKDAHEVKFTISAMPKRELKEPRARWILRHAESVYKDYFEMATEAVEDMAKAGLGPEWKFCLVPSFMFEKLQDGLNRLTMTDQLENLGQAHLIEEYAKKISSSEFSNIYAAIMYSWRYSKGIYNFDEELLKSLYLTSLPLQLNPEILHRLPEYCVYLKTPGMVDWEGNELQGIFAMAEGFWIGNDDDNEEDDFEIYLYILTDPGQSDDDRGTKTQILRMPISADEFIHDLDECLDFLEIVDSPHNEIEPDIDELVDWISPFLNQLLYLCSEEPEIENKRNDNSQPGTETVQKTRKGLRLYTPTRINEWLCGWRTGSFIRAQKESENQNKSSDSTRSVRPHLRRAHWHTYYTGKRDAAERTIKLKWLPMIKVNISEGGENKLPAVIKKVKKDNYEH